MSAVNAKASSYQIDKVANGFMVRFPPDLSRDCVYRMSEVYVFPTWADASEWLGERLGEPPEESA
jgi:hypothetical protein